MLHIVTDGAADLPDTWEQEYNIHVIPINIQFGEKTYLQFVDMGFEAFYRTIKETRTIPKTSQPTPHQFSQYYQKIAKEGDTILSIHVTSKLSGTYASSVAAAEELKDKYHVFPFDSLSGSLSLGFMCKIARDMDRAGKSVEQILAYLESVRDRPVVILTLDKLDYARMSGRVGTLSAALASVLNVKPIAVLRDGILNMTDKVRTRKAAIDRVIDIGKAEFGDKPVILGVVHARDLASGQSLMEKSKKSFNVKSAELTELSVALAVQFGPGTVGLILYPA